MSQDLHSESASWRPRRAGSHPKTSSLKTQEEPMFPFESRGRKKPASQCEGHQEGLFLTWRKGQPFGSFQAFNRLDEACLRQGNVLYSSIPI